MKLVRSQTIPASIDEVWKFFADPHNLAAITPDAMNFSIESAPDRDLRLDDVIRYRLRIGGIPIRWVSKITDWRPGVSFVDLQLRGPYRRWRHLHAFEATSNGTRMTDEIEYELPMGWLGALVAGRYVERQLEKIFDHRSRIINSVFGDTGDSQ